MPDKVRQPLRGWAPVNRALGTRFAALAIAAGLLRAPEDRRRHGLVLADCIPVSYRHLAVPTSLSVYVSGGDVLMKTK